MKRQIIYSTLLLLITGCSLTACGGGGAADVDTPDMITPPIVNPPVITPPVVIPPAVTPIAVSAASFNNKNLITTDATQLPSFRLLRDVNGWQFSPSESTAGCNTSGCVNGVLNDRSLAFADFLQDGTYSAFFTVWRRTGIHNEYLKNVPIVDAANRVYFAKFINGKWVDKTDVLLKTEADKFTCVSHSYTAVADFNNDNKPDLFVSCHGIDYSFGPGDTVSGKGIAEIFPTTWRDILFENQLMYLSQPDGTYKRTVVPGRVYGHHASTADINSDGKVDIITTNSSWGNTSIYEDYRPYFLLGNGDGTFTKNYNLLPQNIISTVGSRIHIYWTYLIPTVNNRVDLVVVGDKIAWYKNPGNGDFSNVTPTFIPLDVSYQASPLDILYKDGNFFVNHSGGDWPGVMRIKRVNADTMSVTEIYTLNRDLGMSEGAISPQLKITRDGNFLVPYVAGCQRDMTDPVFNTSKCSIRIPLQ